MLTKTELKIKKYVFLFLILALGIQNQSTWPTLIELMRFRCQRYGLPRHAAQEEVRQVEERGAKGGGWPQDRGAAQAGAEEGWKGEFSLQRAPNSSATAAAEWEKERVCKLESYTNTSFMYLYTWCLMLYAAFRVLISMCSLRARAFYMYTLICDLFIVLLIIYMWIYVVKDSQC